MEARFSHFIPQLAEAIAEMRKHRSFPHAETVCSISRKAWAYVISMIIDRGDADGSGQRLMDLLVAAFPIVRELAEELDSDKLDHYADNIERRTMCLEALMNQDIVTFRELLRDVVSDEFQDGTFAEVAEGADSRNHDELAGAM